MSKRWKSYRRLRRRDIPVFAALPVVCGLPFVGMQWYWFGPSDRLLSLLTSQFRLSADALTAVMLGIYVALLGLAMLATDRFLRRFLGPLIKDAESSAQ